MPHTDQNKERLRQQTKYQRLKKENPFRLKCWAIKSKATFFNLPFNISADYLKSIWTGCCFFSGQRISFDYNRRDEWSAEVDRLFPNKGYIKGNVVWVSRRFNRLKQDGTAEEHRLIADKLETLKKEYGNEA